LKPDFYIKSPGQRLLFSMFIAISSFLIFSLIALLISLPFINIFKAGTNLENLSDHHNVLILKFLQIIQTFGLFIIPALILSYFFYGSIKSVFNYGVKPKLISAVVLIVLMIIAIPVLNYIIGLNSHLVFPSYLKGVEKWMKDSEESASKITEAFLNVNTIKGLLFNIFIIGILPSFGEELIFRGIMQKIFIDWTKNTHIGIIISAVIFSAIHLQFYGFIPRFLLGAFFGYLLEWSGTIWLPILAHFVNNAFSVVVSYFINANILNDSIENVGSDNATFYYAVISFLLTTFLIIVIYKNEKRKKNFSMINGL
jgi:uncharacterized protein